ncbi:MAG: DivIVA domain-containing protein [Acidimicrobiia bacterium]
MDVTPQELRNSEIKEERRGYHRDQTDDLLERAAATIEALTERVNGLSERVAEVESSSGRTQDSEGLLQRTLLLAQRTADETVAEAKERADQMVEEATLQADTTVRNAEAEARRLAEAERSRIESEVARLISERDALAANVEALDTFESDYRDRLRAAIAGDLETLTARPPVETPERPALHETDIPAGPERYATPDDRAASGEYAATTDTPEPGGADVASSEHAEPDNTVELGMLERAEMGLPEPGEPDDGPAGGSAPLEAVPVDVPADDVSPETTGEVSQPVARGRLFTSNEDDTDDEPGSLDDDAFFASLRDAVRDDAPLGPRDEGDDATAFDQDDVAENSGRFGDMFRRGR